MSTETPTVQVQRAIPTPSIDHAGLWAAVVAVVIVGDTATTLVGLHFGAVEANPVVALLLDAGGAWMLPALKAVQVALLVAAFQLAPSPYRLGIPIGALLVGVVAVANNLVILSVVMRA